MLAALVGTATRRSRYDPKPRTHVTPIELSQIAYFVTLARTLHFTRAAEACNVSQPALTKAVQKLEEELGGPLLHRERGNTQLTELGRLMLPPLERALALAREAKQQAEAFRQRESSPLRIGLEYSVPASLLTPVLAALRRKCEHIDLRLRQGSQADLCQRMLDSELDIALMVDGPGIQERLHRWPLFAEHYIVICSPEHRFRDRDHVAPSDLAQEDLVLHESEDCPVRQYIGRLYESLGTAPRMQHFASSQEHIIEMVLASLGISLAGERLPTPLPLLRRPFDTDSDCRDVILTVLAGRPLGPTPALFLKLLRARSWEQSDPEAAFATAAAA